jgi:hypothetical protein
VVNMAEYANGLLQQAAARMGTTPEELRFQAEEYARYAKEWLLDDYDLDKVPEREEEEGE